MLRQWWKVWRSGGKLLGRGHSFREPKFELSSLAYSRLEYLSLSVLYTSVTPMYISTRWFNITFKFQTNIVMYFMSLRFPHEDTLSGDDQDLRKWMHSRRPYCLWNSSTMNKLGRVSSRRWASKHGIVLDVAWSHIPISQKTDQPSRLFKQYITYHELTTPL